MQSSKWVTLLVGSLCLIAVAGMVGTQHLYYMAAILLALPMISYMIGWYSLRGLDFHREIPSSAWEGEEGNIIYAVKNISPVSRFFLSIHEALPSWIGHPEESPLFNAVAQETARVVHPVRFRKRGVYQAKSFDITAMDPLGVFAFTKRIPCPAELVVYPMPKPLRAQALSGSERYGWQDFSSVLLKGTSVDPDGVRMYVPGDPLRRIHWRQTARTGKLSVIEFEEAQSIHLVILLDLQHGTEVGKGTETTLEYGVRLAASSAQQAIQQGAQVSLRTAYSLDEDVDISGIHRAASQPARGQEQLFLILDALARVEADVQESVSSVVLETIQNIASGTTLLIITSQPDEALAEALIHYTAMGANVAVVYVDPVTFEGGQNRIKPEVASEFLLKLQAVHTHTFVLRQNPEGFLYPEVIGNGSQNQSFTH